MATCTFGTPRFNGGVLVYSGSGQVSQTVNVQLGAPNCKSMDTVYYRAGQRAAYKGRADNWFMMYINGKLAAVGRQEGCFINLKTKRPVRPPARLVEMFNALSKSQSG